MLLTSAEIQRLSLIGNANLYCYRPAGYDLQLGMLITTDGKIAAVSDENPYILEPHGMVEVIAVEFMQLPDDIVGYAHVRTTLCNSGVLALNIGIVDPGYDDHLSTTLMNFSKDAIELRPAERFLRLTFHRLGNESPRPPRAPLSPAEIQAKRVKYLSERRKKARAHFSKTFLDVEGTAKEAAEKAFSLWRDRLLIWGPAFILVLALATFAMNFVAPKPTLAFGDMSKLIDERVHEAVSAMVVQQKGQPAAHPPPAQPDGGSPAAPKRPAKQSPTPKSPAQEKGGGQ